MRRPTTRATTREKTRTVREKRAKRISGPAVRAMLEARNAWGGGILSAVAPVDWMWIESLYR